MITILYWQLYILVYLHTRLRENFCVKFYSKRSLCATMEHSNKYKMLLKSITLPFGFALVG